MSFDAIARALDVDSRTVAKAVQWINSVQDGPE